MPNALSMRSFKTESEENWQKSITCFISIIHIIFLTFNTDIFGIPNLVFFPVKIKRARRGSNCGL